MFEPNSFVPLATLQNGAIYWYQCDQIGTPQELTDQFGEVVWAVDYTVWGEAQKHKTDIGSLDSSAQYRKSAPIVCEQPFRFQGQHFDIETGLHYNRFRYFDPAIGRFISEDPIKTAGGTNPFSYAPNPILWADPLGLAANGQLDTYGSLNGGLNVGDNLDVHELVRHEALVQMGCAKKKRRNKDNPSIALDPETHDSVHAHENALARQHLSLGVNTFQFNASGFPSKQQIDVWQGSIRKSGLSAAHARRLRKSAEKYLKSLCCCP